MKKKRIQTQQSKRESDEQMTEREEHLRLRFVCVTVPSVVNVPLNQLGRHRGSPIVTSSTAQKKTSIYKITTFFARFLTPKHEITRDHVTHPTRSTCNQTHNTTACRTITFALHACMVAKHCKTVPK